MLGSFGLIAWIVDLGGACLESLCLMLLPLC
jgi:hypothetical protein